MAPAKNPNANSNNNQNSNSPNSTDQTNNLATSTMRKQTGTVPKTTTTSTTSKNSITTSKRLTTSISQQQQQQQQRKNTEIVAPIRRDLKDLNDYLLSTVVNTTVNNNSNQQQPTTNGQRQQHLKPQNSTNNNSGFNKHQQTNFSDTNTVVSGTDIEYLQESQRFCYPVRPTPRRNPDQQHNINSTNLNNYNTNLINQAATIGVVIPTPGLASNAEEHTTNQNHPHQLEQQQQQLVLVPLQQLIDEPLLSTYRQQQNNILPTNLLDLATSLSPSTVANQQLSGYNTNQNDSFILQRLQLIRQFLNLTTKSSLNTNITATATLPTPQAAASRSSTDSTKSINKHSKPKMPNLNGQEVLVNSTSLEDVALSETSDRAQSIQSLHSIETPTPDNTPSYEDLQERLERSNRNIQNMQEQQQQLLRLQSTAKQHLNDMERLRQYAGNLSFATSNQPNSSSANGDVPDYETIDQVHADMENLVGRMKNLTSFIHNQNELSSLLGDDGPEIIAEQEALQRKLESLRTQRDEMRNLVDELQDINKIAEKNAREPKHEYNDEEKNLHSTSTVKKNNTKSERTVPVEYSRVVPIEVLQPQKHKENTNTNNISNEEAESAALLQQKVADIEAMKQQLKRLRDMMDTVNLIEDHTSRDVRDIGRTPRDSRSLSSTNSYDRERTPVASISSAAVPNNGNDEFISHKVRMLNEVTSDLRAQAESLEAERNRIKALKKEIARRKEQAAAAAQLGEDALKRHSLTPTPIPQIRQRIENSHAEQDQLKADYEAKKKEFELLCQRLQDEDKEMPTSMHTNNAQDILSEVEEDTEDFNSNYNTSRVASSNIKCAANLPTTCNKVSHESSVNINGGVVNTTCNSTQDGTSFEAGSLKSGSSQSYSIPPSMPVMGVNNWSGPIPPPLPTAWNHHYFYGAGIAPQPTAVGVHTPPHINSLHTASQPVSTSAAPSNECICSAASNINTLSNTGAGAANYLSGTATSQVGSDPVLLQQFVQTQQMLINSVCQCNQMLWHQQREIDSLNNTIHILQDRLLALTGPSAADLSINLRAESVPPASIAGTVPNNVYTNINRAQSEQPVPFLTGLSTLSARSAFINCHQQQQQLHQQQQQHLFQQRQRSAISAGNGYNYSTETQQHNASSASACIYGTLNNATQPTTQSAHFNNEAPQSPLTTGQGPGPIFMHHHNNSIHQNNANLRSQNHYANNLQQQPQHQQQHNNVTNDGNTLNNQVQPGNRANNFWDNFRSYSRQNLLSINSNKSNEEQHTQCVSVTRNTNEQQQQQQQFENCQRLQNQQRFYEQQRFRILPTARTNIDDVRENVTQEQRERDYLLRPVQTVEDYDFMPNISVRTDNTIESFDNNNDNDEDTTSEEIKRNLLVNALKNDKFTTKFYESIKEDVFRRLESMILESDNNYQRTHHETSIPQFVNDVSSQSGSRDPLRKLHLNARLYNQYEQQQQQQQQQFMQANQMELDEQEEMNNADTESNNAENESSAFENSNSSNIKENDKPEEDNNESTMDLAQQAEDKNNEFVRTEYVKSNRQTTKSNKKTKVEHGKEANEMKLEGACSLAAQLAKSANKIIAVPQKCSKITPDFDFIRNLITCIRNRIQAQPIITDQILAEIIKLTTATAAERTQNISPTVGFSFKKIYAKIKKSAIPRQREEFLNWYESYMEKIFLIEQNGTLTAANSNCQGNNENYTKNKLQRNYDTKILQNIQGDSNSIEIKNFTKETTDQSFSLIHNNVPISINIQNQQESINTDDADLAEADQICSANTSSSTTNLTSTLELTHDADKQENILIALDNFENNENPEEEKPNSSTSENTLNSISSESIEESDASIKEKNNSKKQIDDEETIIESNIQK